MTTAALLVSTSPYVSTEVLDSSHVERNARNDGKYIHATGSGDYPSVSPKSLHRDSGSSVKEFKYHGGPGLTMRGFVRKSPHQPAANFRGVSGESGARRGS
ncbi:predicted protein [Chaetomium globosum CBS 148.51]|uniref:Uncharacterized protein n=1 Tax=Chaetomium globosum (strain ATCC 6205 / CBS 148.51 / DSM 1962 / NBRC 6347 / NRRL 1970) TaxID=306901 RepID=Q2GY22_CHAGB|nr:uncharacterized protein CHGG_07132 [Chaetomium globosum CBS 148.51]EAQ85879.1 predicted protein [Chaetomium globosum CBS 148.51]